MKGTTLSVITAIDTHDVRFPTSRELDGSDAMNPDPDYSAAYLVLRTSDDSHQGHGFTFTIGRGNDVQLAAFDPYWIEEPTSPDDILGHASIRRGVAPVKLATGEHVQNRIVFKQLLQAGAIDILQLDSARVAGVNENLAILLLAAKFGMPVCPHAGGVGLCELVQHLSMFDYVALSGTTENRVIEFVDHLHEHFLDPVVIEHGHYKAPTLPGFSAEMHPATITTFEYPNGEFWTTDLAATQLPAQAADTAEKELTA
ncbi:enolase C-terminal domain-like protein [Kitasatospora sp. NPDC006697]|uniref:enolase C-terminal domain-like protein n=1 Tax=Kitasatospora sp. NPDC006697 TaxID=3364020 RepID=UPI00369D29D9